MQYISHLIFFILGLVIGSFLGAYTYRLPRGEKISSGRSKCDKCDKLLSWYDNIPIVSYLFLKGRCRNCNKLISPRYPVIELSTGLLFVLVSLVSTDFFELIFLFVISCLMIAIFVIDLEHQIIPDQLVFFGLAISLIWYLVIDKSVFYNHIFSGFAASIFLLVLHIITNGAGMGLGDVKLAILLGILLGPLAIYWLFGAFLTGAVVGIILIIMKKAQLRKPIAFGPFMIASFFVVYLFFK